MGCGPVGAVGRGRGVSRITAPRARAAGSRPVRVELDGERFALGRARGHRGQHGLRRRPGAGSVRRSASGWPWTPMPKPPTARRSAPSSAARLPGADLGAGACAKGQPRDGGRGGASSGRGAGAARRRGVRPPTTSRPGRPGAAGRPVSLAISSRWGSSATRHRPRVAEHDRGLDDRRASARSRSPASAPPSSATCRRQVKRRRVLAFLARRGFSGREVQRDGGEAACA